MHPLYYRHIYDTMGHVISNQDSDVDHLFEIWPYPTGLVLLLSERTSSLLGIKGNGCAHWTWLWTKTQAQTCLSWSYWQSIAPRALAEHSLGHTDWVDPGESIGCIGLVWQSLHLHGATTIIMLRFVGIWWCVLVHFNLCVKFGQNFRFIGSNLYMWVQCVAVVPATYFFPSPTTWLYFDSCCLRILCLTRRHTPNLACIGPICVYVPSKSQCSWDILRLFEC